MQHGSPTYVFAKQLSRVHSGRLCGCINISNAIIVGRTNTTIRGKRLLATSPSKRGTERCIYLSEPNCVRLRDRITTVQFLRCVFLPYETCPDFRRKEPSGASMFVGQTEHRGGMRLRDRITTVQLLHCDILLYMTLCMRRDQTFEGKSRAVHQCS